MQKALAGRVEMRELLGVTGVGAVPGGKANKCVLGSVSAVWSGLVVVPGPWLICPIGSVQLKDCG